MKAYKVIDHQGNEKYYMSEADAKKRFKEAICEEATSLARGWADDELDVRADYYRTLEQLDKLIEFKDSDTGRMICDFINNHVAGATDIHTRYKATFDVGKLAEIEKYLQDTGNPYQIEIRRYKPGGECYGPAGDYFYIGATNNYYYFHNFDIDDDIQGLKRTLSHYKGCLRLPIDMSKKEMIKKWFKKAVSRVWREGESYMCEIEIG